MELTSSCILGTEFETIEASLPHVNAECGKKTELLIKYIIIPDVFCSRVLRQCSNQEGGWGEGGGVGELWEI